MAHITRADIESWLALEEKRKSFARQAKALEVEADKIGERILAFVEENGGKGRQCLRSGYALAIKTAKAQVAWKAAFVEVAGHAAAEKLAKNPPLREFLSVEIADGGKAVQDSSTGA